MGVKSVGGSTRAALRFILLAHGISLVVLLGLLLAAHQAFPARGLVVWGILAGVAGGLSLTAFYMALARGAMGVPAALSGLLAAAIPAVVSSVVEGSSGGLRWAGFVVAAVAIWMIAAGPPVSGSESKDRKTFWLAIGGGAGFGFYFVALRMANSLGVVWPMALARVGSIATCGVLWLLLRASAAVHEEAPWKLRGVAAWAIGVAALDTAGNMLFVAATQRGRLDVAAVLASLYPASTILLAAWRLHERPTRRQWAGMVTALIAVLLITLRGAR
jgi:drug/metabolite transporter (DMT)-like permease